MGKPSEMEPFAILAPRQWTRPAIFNSPHSGRMYPEDFLAASRLNPHALRKSEDCYIDELFAFVADLGSPLLHAHFPRAYLDVNREPYELDPRMFREELPGFANVSSMRVAGGLGTIPRIVSEGDEIYGAPCGSARRRPHRDDLPALSPHPGRSHQPGARRFRLCASHRLPFDALHRLLACNALADGAGGYRDRRSPWGRLRR